MRIFWTFLLVVAYIVAAVIILNLVVSGLALFGGALSIMGAILIYYSAEFRAWLTGRKGYQQRLSKWPGWGSEKPAELALTVLLYGLPLSLISYLLVGRFANGSELLLTVFKGLAGFGLGYGWLIHGWRLEGEHTAAALAWTDLKPFTRQVGPLLLTGLALFLPLCAMGTGLWWGNGENTTPEKTTVAVDDMVDEKIEEESDSPGAIGDAAVAQLAAEGEEKSDLAEEQAPVVINEITNTPTQKATATSTVKPTVTNTRPPTATPKAEVRVSASSVNLRNGPGVSFEAVGVGQQNDTFEVIATNEDGSWYNVRLPNGQFAWVGQSVVEEVVPASFDLITAARTIPAPIVVQLPEPTSPPVATNAPATETPPPIAAATEPPPTEAPPPTAVVEQPPALPAGVPGFCTCSGPDLDCGNFSTHNQAQACFNYCMERVGYDIYRLDGDNDGSACESLP